jgi:tryptophanyl-tRNA synthetase
MDSGINLLADAASAVAGAGTGGLIVFGVMKAKIEKNAEDLKNILANAVFQKQCDNCKENWMGQISVVRDEIRNLRDELNNNINQVIDLAKNEQP